MKIKTQLIKISEMHYKAILRGKFIALNVFILEKISKSQSNNQRFHIKKLDE